MCAVGWKKFVDMTGDQLGKGSERYIANSNITGPHKDAWDWQDWGLTLEALPPRTFLNTLQCNEAHDEFGWLVWQTAWHDDTLGTWHALHLPCSVQLKCFAPRMLCTLLTFACFSRPWPYILCSSSSSSSSLGQYIMPFTIQSWTMLPVMNPSKVRYHQLSINEHAPAKFCMSAKFTSSARPSVDAQIYTCLCAQLYTCVKAITYEKVMK